MDANDQQPQEENILQKLRSEYDQLIQDKKSISIQIQTMSKAITDLISEETTADDKIKAKMDEIEKFHLQNHEKLKNEFTENQKILETKESQLEERKRNQEDELKRIDQLRKAVSASRVWKLSVEGVIKQVTHATLTKVRHSDLAKMFEEYDKVETEKDGSVFIDRDIVSFMLVINYLRNDCRPLKQLNQEQIKCLEDELDFWKIPHLHHPTFIKLEEVMKSVPQAAHEWPLKNWKQEGPLQIRRHVMQGRMRFDPHLEY